MFSLCAQKSDIMQALFKCFPGTIPNSVSLYVNSDKILVWKCFPEPDGILSFATPDFKHNGVGVAKKRFAPFPFELEWVDARVNVLGLQYVGKAV